MLKSIILRNRQPILSESCLIIIFFNEIGQLSHFLGTFTINQPESFSKVIDFGCHCLSDVADRPILSEIDPCVGVEMENIKNGDEYAFAHEHV